MNIIPGRQRILDEAHQEIAKKGETEGVAQLRIPWLPATHPANKIPVVEAPVITGTGISVHKSSNVQVGNLEERPCMAPFELDRSIAGNAEELYSLQKALLLRT